MTLEPVINWYNVTFDIAFWMVLHLFVRGAFRDIHVNYPLCLPLANHPNALVTDHGRFDPEQKL